MIIIHWNLKLIIINFQCTINNACPEEFPILNGRECKKDIKIPNMEKNLIYCFNNGKTVEIEYIVMIQF